MLQDNWRAGRPRSGRGKDGRQALSGWLDYKVFLKKCREGKGCEPKDEPNRRFGVKV